MSIENDYLYNGRMFIVSTVNTLRIKLKYLTEMRNCFSLIIPLFVLVRLVLNFVQRPRAEKLYKNKR